ncbi:Uncharacterized protein Adt_31263 [Abeliophyllum distichum]|uniref:Retrovirus-related Pol polyprotein from transposon TNT 1-94-like beta-barrel domain-containing protein n=1 Tax=Abeliophyllum distichum TaxID=126358 RepID=A0ABD1RDL4_9LAMI
MEKDYHLTTIEVEEEEETEEATLTEMTDLSAKSVERLDTKQTFVTSGASNHVTVEMENINSRNEHTGKEKIMVGNGNNLHISHIGVTCLPTLIDKPLMLNKRLHVPAIKKNLISVSHLTFDNHVYMEFHSNCCFVKDKLTRRVMLQEKLRKGLYQLEFPYQNNESNVQ